MGSNLREVLLDLEHGSHIFEDHVNVKEEISFLMIFSTVWIPTVRLSLLDFSSIKNSS